MSEEKEKISLSKHLPTVVLGGIIVAIFLTLIFSFQINSDKFGIITTFGKNPTAVEPGLHFRWPYPIQKITKYDSRPRSFNGIAGRLEETLTKDEQSIIVGIFVRFVIEDKVKFFQNFKTMAQAEELLNSLMRAKKNEVISSHNFNEFINIQVSEIQIPQIENELLTTLNSIVKKQYGINILASKIINFSLPEKITAQVADRMIAERNVVAENTISQGKSEAQGIKDEADKQKNLKVADAMANAKIIRAEGDAIAADYYSAFKENPELAIFLKKLDAMKIIMRSKTTLILDTNSAPFDILKMGSETLKPQNK